MNILCGILLSVLAGSMNGLFALPMKSNRGWVWENTWLPFSVLSLILFPWLTAWLTIPHLLAACSHIPLADGIQAMCWGFFIYSGSLLFGLSIDILGMGLAFALLIGTMTVVGVLGPYAVHGSLLRSPGSSFILGGVTLCVLSVILASSADRAAKATQEIKETRQRLYLFGVPLAVLGGALSGLLPIAMISPWSLSIQNAAQVYGHSSAPSSSNAVLVFILLGGSIPNCGYCAWLLAKKKTFQLYLTSSRSMYWLGVLIMGILYSASIAVWGTAVSPRFLGPLGPSVGWALFVGTIVLSSTAAGLLSGEWRGAGRASLYRLGLSVASLVTGMVLICLGNYTNLTA